MPKQTDSDATPTVYAVIDGKRVPLDRTAALHLAQNAHLLALGDPEYAHKMVAEAEHAERERTAVA